MSRHITRLYAALSLNIQRGDIVDVGAQRRYLVVDVHRSKTQQRLDVFRPDAESWMRNGLWIAGRAPVVHELKQVVRLNVVDSQTEQPRAQIEFREGVPASRAECIDGPRPCPYIRCKFHLWRIDSADRPGKPHNGKRAGTTLRPAWLEWPLPPSCALDFIDRGESSSSEIAQAMGTHRGNVWLIWQRPHVRAAFEALRNLLPESEDK